MADPAIFYRNPRLTLLVVGLFVVSGASALFSLPRQEDPNTLDRAGVVTTFLPGSPAERVESLLTAPVERKLREVPEVENLWSFSEAGTSLVIFELDEDLSDTAPAFSKIRDRLRSLEPGLPPQARGPEFRRQEIAADALVIAVTGEEDAQLPIAVVTRLAKRLADRLRRVPGTKRVVLHGEAVEEITVTADPAALTAAGLTVDEVSRAIVASDAKVPAGAVRNDDTDLVIEVEGPLRSAERIRSVPIWTVADATAIRVADVARVERGTATPPRSIAQLGGVRGVAVAARIEEGIRVDAWAQEARRVVAQFSDEVPRAVGVRVIFDQGVHTEERLFHLGRNLVGALAVVFVVLIATMGLRSALVISTSLPLTVAAVLTGFLVADVPLHQISVTGTIIALGLLIDNAIVVVDRFSQLRAREVATVDAVSQSVRQLFVPLLASTATTALAFMPIMLSPGQTGEFIGTLGLAVVLSVAASFAFSLTVIPAIAGFLDDLRGGTRSHGLPDGRGWRLFRRSVRIATDRPWLGVTVSLILPAIGFTVAATLPVQFFPTADRSQFEVQITLPSETSIRETHRQVREVDRVIAGLDGIVASHWFIGGGGPAIYYNSHHYLTAEGSSNFAAAFVEAESPRRVRELVGVLQAKLRREFPDGVVLALPFEQGPGFSAPVDVRVIGPDLHELRAIGEDIRRELAASANVIYTRSGLSRIEPKLVVQPFEDEVRLAGLTLTEIATQLDARLEGVVGGSVFEATEELPVRVKLGTSRDDRLYRHPGLVLLSRPDQALADRFVPLSAVSGISLGPEFGKITRRNGQRVNSVEAFLLPYSLPNETVRDFLARYRARGIEVPDGYRIEFGGEEEARSKSMAHLFAYVAPLVVLMVAIIVLTFDSFRLAGIVIAVGLLSVGLSLFGVWLFGYPLGFMAILGTMGLVGLAINGAIVVLSALEAAPRARRGDIGCIQETTFEATRHILSTTLTTLGGFTPLILSGGNFWPPLATAVAGGVAGSAVLALYFVPSAYRIATRDRGVPFQSPRRLEAA